MTTLHATFHTEAFGELQLIGTGAGLRGLSLAGQRHFLTPPAGSREDPSASLFTDTLDQLAAYAGGARSAFDLPLDLVGTPLQVAVWEALRLIERGETMTYGELGLQIGRPGIPRAIGQAVGRNPVSIVVPCHRVVGASGALTGYAGGLDRKRQLLGLDGIIQPAAG